MGRPIQASIPPASPPNNHASQLAGPPNAVLGGPEYLSERTQRP